MDLTLPLAELVTQVDGAFGAVLVDNDGEAVSFFALPGPPEPGVCEGEERVKLIGAYQIITLRACRRLARQFGASALKHLVCRFETSIIIIKALDGNYALMLAMREDSNVGRGMIYLDRTAEIINQDL